MTIREFAKFLFAAPLVVHHEIDFLPYRIGLWNYQKKSYSNCPEAVLILKQIYISGKCDKYCLSALIERVPVLYSEFDLSKECDFKDELFKVLLR
jgi:hypothetical protein